ncbi:tetratricopeptide repeat protein [Aquibium microcysteis]|uniref:tetratricopeptide repeat protein n=1 Tax=Aquibium microcysteis TaxID=675281 RepID=UPI00165CF6FB|nr:hypothetical protein [Aquibium microcysteis]
MHASSRLVEETDPGFAIALFPLNVDATTTLVERLLDGQEAGADVSRAQEVVEKAIALNAGHARLQSLKAEILLREGDRSGAADGFERALRLSRTESVALQRTIAWSIEAEEVVGALENIDVLLRRHPWKIRDLGSIFAAIVTTPEGYRELRRRLLVGPPWAAAVFRQIAADPPSLAAGASLLTDLHKEGAPVGDWGLSTIVQALIREGRPMEAYNLFLATQSAEEAALAGYVHDAGFQGTPSNKPFDWQIRSRSGHTVERLPHPSFASAKSGLLIQFNGTPVKDMQASQVLALPPGLYDLSATLTAANAKLPKGLYWSLRCLSSSREFARLSIAEGSYRDETVSAAFEVTALDCPLQIVSIHTAVIAESWKDRYLGSVVVQRLQIRKSAS